MSDEHDLLRRGHGAGSVAGMNGSVLMRPGDRHPFGFHSTLLKFTAIAPWVPIGPESSARRRRSTDLLAVLDQAQQRLVARNHCLEAERGRCQLEDGFFGSRGPVSTPPG
jgi:hypothetical protein